MKAKLRALIIAEKTDELNDRFDEWADKNNLLLTSTLAPSQVRETCRLAFIGGAIAALHMVADAASDPRFFK